MGGRRGADRVVQARAYRMGAGARRGLAAGALVVALLAVMLPAFADTPESGLDPTVTLTVTPSAGLAPDQSVVVTGTGFPPNTSGVIRQCGGNLPAAPQCDLDLAGTFTTGPNGEIPPTNAHVVRIIDTGTATFNCGIQTCALVATAGGKSAQHHVRNAGAGTVVPTSSPPSTVTTLPLPGFASLCGVLRSILEPFPFLGGFVQTLLAMLGCGSAG